VNEVRVALSGASLKCSAVRTLAILRGLRGIDFCRLAGSPIAVEMSWKGP